MHYGYIVDIKLHKSNENNTYWPFSRYNEDESISSYNGIASINNYDSDKNIVIIGDVTGFNEWRYEFLPENER